MDEAEQLSDLIGDIYDAALDVSLWPGALKKAARFIQGCAASIAWKDVTNNRGDFYLCDDGMDPHYIRLYFDQYIAFDPNTAGQFAAKLEEPIATADTCRYEDFLQTRTYLEWAKPQGLVDCVSALLDKSATRFAMFFVFRDERDGIVDDETRRRMRLLAPHVRRAALIANVIDFTRAETAAFTETLDGLRAGVLFVDPNGRMVHANIAGQTLLAEGNILREVDGRLASGDRQTDQNLLEIFTAAAQGDTAVGAKGIALPLTAKTGEQHVAHVLPLASGARRRAGPTAAAALFVQRAALETSSPPDAIAETYQLTTMELRVLHAIVEVGGVPEAADALGVAGSTVKTHLRRIYQKTGIARQADLVKLVAGFSSPLKS